MRFLQILTLLGAAVAAALGPSTSAAVAQEVQRIAAIVNDDVISGYDLERRVELVIRSTKMADSPETRRQLRAKVLELLIDEKLQLQAAARLNIQVSDKEMDEAIARLEHRNHVPAGRFDDFVRSMGVDKDSLMQQIRAQLAWNKVLLRNLPTIPDEEVDEAMQKLEANVGKPEYRVSEIFLPTDASADERTVLETARDLRTQIQGGVPFGSAAREFSRGATAADGGEVGWVKPDQLGREIGRVLAEMQIGEVSEPIREPNGYYLIQLHERRRFMAADPSEIKVALRQVLFAVPEGAGRSAVGAAERKARDFAAKAGGCGELEASAAGDDGADYIDLGTLAMGQLAADIRAAVQSLPVDQFSQPVVGPPGVMLFMVCKRTEPDEEGLDRGAVLEDLTRQRLAQIAQRQIRDLRRDALVEYR